MQNVQFKIIFRGWIKNRTYTLISLISLITGITCCSLLVTFVIHEYNIAHSILNSKNSYLVQEQREQDATPSEALISGKSGVQLKNTYPEIKAYCVFRNEHLLLSEESKEPDYMYAYSVTPNFTEFFKLPLLSGDLHQTLLSSNEIAVTRSFALQYFGIANPIGKSITLGHSIRHFDGKENTYKTIFKSYTITTVIDDSQKSFLHYGILRGLPDEEVSQITGFPFYTFIELTPEITVQKFLAKINDRNEGQFEDITSDLSLSDLYAGYTPLVLILLLGTIIIIPPLYVILKINKNSLSKILKNENKQKTILIRNIVITQFTISIILTTTVVNIHHQMDFATHCRPHANEILILGWELYSVEDETIKIFYDQLTSIPEITHRTMSAITQNCTYGLDNMYVDCTDADLSFFDFYDIQLLEGRLFSPGKQGLYEAIVNETFLKKQGITEPLGKTFQIWDETFTIVGVVADYPRDKLTREITPLFIRFSDTGSDRHIIRIQPGTRKIVEEKINALWEQVAPGAIEIKTCNMAERFMEFHEEELQVMKILSIFSYISILLAGVGLFGLAWFSVENRRKEISLRKINGASENQITVLLCARFIKWILIAFCIGAPVAYYCSAQWLTQFVYKNEISPVSFIFIGIAVVFIGTLTVAWQAFKASRMNPVDSIK
ncbi:MAG: ABC transporter permease [Sanguibacteroides justesenii]|nr:ABC transporter permease [Sanguibacteroides justesenii]